jgi:hypothetical protein
VGIDGHHTAFLVKFVEGYDHFALRSQLFGLRLR